MLALLLVAATFDCDFDLASVERLLLNKSSLEFSLGVLSPGCVAIFCLLFHGDERFINLARSFSNAREEV